MDMLKVLAILAFAAGMALPAAAQKTDLSGTWKLNLEKSFLAGDHPAKDYEFTKVFLQRAGGIQQTDIARHVSMMNIPMPDSSITTDLVIDGKEHEVMAPAPFPGMPPSKSKVVAEWQGGTLLLTESGQSFGGRSLMQRRYFLSEDGSRLYELVEGHNGFGDTAQRLVFDKQR
jgi:hypothetical protein